LGTETIPEKGNLNHLFHHDHGRNGSKGERFFFRGRKRRKNPPAIDFSGVERLSS